MWFSVSDPNETVRLTSLCPTTSTGETSVMLSTVEDEVDSAEGSPRRMAAMSASRGSVLSQSVVTFHTFLRGVIPVGTSSWISDETKWAVRSMSETKDELACACDLSNDFDVFACCE